MTARYTVYNAYRNRKSTHHRKFVRAVEARERHEGLGWVIYDEEKQILVEPRFISRKGGGYDIVPGRYC